MLIRISRNIIKGSRFYFANDKDKDDFQTQKYKRENLAKGFGEREQEKAIEIQKKFTEKSAKLYDRYMQARTKPMMTLDNYQLHYTFILERLPIHHPFDSRTFQYSKARYQIASKTGYLTKLPKDLHVQRIESIFNATSQKDIENKLTHFQKVSEEIEESYYQKSRNWSKVDPDIEDPKSIQTFSSDNVILIVKNKSGKWTFPTRAMSQLQSHQKFFSNFIEELFFRESLPMIYFGDRQPCHFIKRVDETIQKGQGIMNLFYRGISIKGIPNIPNQIFDDYAWVPKAHIAKYFDDEYFEDTIKLTTHLF